MSDKALIEPRVLRGFRDTLPATALARDYVFRTAGQVFRSFGYLPIDTPALEYAEILKGKGGAETDKQLFEFDDAGGRRVALRFDLTVPLARFVAQNQQELVFPFRRYHIAPVWRGERPQKGRYREFYQCDADLVGATGPAADAEAVLVFATLFEALDVGEVTLRINDRRVLNGIFEALGIHDRVTPVMRALDKLDKIGAEGVRKEIAEAGVSDAVADRLLTGLSSVTLAANRPNSEVLDGLAELVEGSVTGREGVEGLRTVLQLVEAAGVPQRRLRLDPSIARGLDYYTGIVFETMLNDMPGIGSVASGGRYDNLAGLYTSTRLPGVGASLGVDRLLAALAELERTPGSGGGPDVLVTLPESGDATAAFALAAAVRRGGLVVEVYPEQRRHANQLRYADRSGARLVLSVDADGVVQAKSMRTGATHTFGDQTTATAECRRLLEAERSSTRTVE